jgi:ATP-dependent DNA ligase
MREFLVEGYEGAVLRAFDSPYVFSVSNRRSDSTLKYKKRDDLEVQVISYTDG